MHASIIRYAKMVFNAAAALSTILTKQKQTKIWKGRYATSLAYCVSVLNAAAYR